MYTRALSLLRALSLSLGCAASSEANDTGRLKLVKSHKRSPAPLALSLYRHPLLLLLLLTLATHFAV